MTLKYLLPSIRVSTILKEDPALLLVKLLETYYSIKTKIPGIEMKVHDLMMSRLVALATIPAINNGGCAIVAHKLHEFLELKGYKPQIFFIIAGYRERNLYNVKEDIVDACHHAVVKVAHRYYHAGGEFDITELPKITFHYIPVTPKYVNRAIQTSGVSWNRRFDRDNVERINTILS